MKKFLLIFIWFFTFTSSIFASCEYEQSKYDSLKAKFENIWNEIRGNMAGTPQYLVEWEVKKRQQEIYDELTILATNLKSCLQKEVDEINKNIDYLTKIFEEWKNAYNKWDFLTAIEKFEEYLRLDPNSESVKNNVLFSYKNYANSEINKQKYDSSILYLKKALTLFPRDFETNMYIWIAYANLNDLDNALKYYNLAYEYATYKEDIDEARKRIDAIKQYKSLEELKEEQEKQAEINKKLEQQKQNELQKQQEKEEKLKQKAQVAFTKIQKLLSPYSEKKQKQTYEWILKTLKWYKTKFTSWDKKIILDHLIYLVNIELWNEDIDLNDLFWDLLNK